MNTTENNLLIARFMTPKQWDALPEHIKEICGTFDENEDSYQECAKLQDRLQSVGWTCDYYLDGVPFDVKPMANTAYQKDSRL
jgi:hypothetical protein